jgi:sulfatase maturation enzyme AslB (radical SAM superfamily)
MLKIGNILINPEDISSVHEELKYHSDLKMEGIQIIQIIYKNGVVKNYTSQEIGMNYSDFINTLLELKNKEETNRIFRLMTALKSINNE